MDVITPRSHERHDNAHRPRWIGLRESEARYARECGSARCEMEKISTGKFHFEPLPLSVLFDHLVGESKQRRRNREVERLRRLEIEHQIEFRRLLDWQIAGLGALENLVDNNPCRRNTS